MVIKKGVSINQAEEMVLATLKESEHYLRNGLIDETIASLRMIHMDETPEQAATKLIKSLLKLGKTKVITNDILTNSHKSTFDSSNVEVRDADYLSDVLILHLPRHLHRCDDTRRKTRL